MHCFLLLLVLPTNANSNSSRNANDVTDQGSKFNIPDLSFWASITNNPPILPLSDTLNLLKELSFIKPNPDPFLQKIRKLPIEVVVNIMQHLSFDQAYEISMLISPEEQVNPLDRKMVNPLKYHDARLDDQSAIRNWIHSPIQSKKVSHLHHLMNNPTVDVYKFRYAITKEAARIGYESLVKEMIQNGVKPSKHLFNNACISGNLDLVKFLADLGDIIPDKWSLRIALSSRNQHIVDFLVTHYGLDRNGWDSFGRYTLESIAAQMTRRPTRSRYQVFYRGIVFMDH